MAASKLLTLNMSAPGERGYASLASPNLDALRRLEGARIDFGFSEEARQARAVAEARFARLGCSAVVHGDVHLRNVLLRADRSSYLIDYGQSGPGHPAIDLVRLELALYLGVFKQTDAEEEGRRLQRVLSLDRGDWDAISSCFPRQVASVTNRVCLEGCALARDAAIEAVTAHGGTQQDYVATKYLLAWQSLIIEGLNTALARGIIDVLSNEITSWAEEA